jgi:hypothetical protein
MEHASDRSIELLEHSAVGRVGGTVPQSGVHAFEAGLALLVIPQHAADAWMQPVDPEQVFEGFVGEPAAPIPAESRAREKNVGLDGAAPVYVYASRVIQARPSVASAFKPHCANGPMRRARASLGA